MAASTSKAPQDEEEQRLEDKYGSRDGFMGLNKEQVHKYVQDALKKSATVKHLYESLQQVCAPRPSCGFSNPISNLLPCLKCLSDGRHARPDQCLRLLTPLFCLRAGWLRHKQNFLPRHQVRRANGRGLLNRLWGACRTACSALHKCA